MNEYSETRTSAEHLCYAFEGGIRLYEDEEETEITEPPSTSRREPSESSLAVKVINRTD